MGRLILGVRFLAVLLLVLALLFHVSGSSFYVAAVTETDAKSAISAAQETIISGYQAVAEAEKAGANVTNLLITLNDAGMLLSKANLEYNKGDFDAAFSLANESRDKLDGLVEDANVLRDAAFQAGFWDFMVNVVGSIVGAISIVVGGFAIWFYLKKKYSGAEGVTG